jgi:hypothetical protein
MKKNVSTRQRFLLTSAISMLLACSGCENNFSPIGDYQKQLVVYCILTSRSDSQFVRVYPTYNPSTEQATDAGVRGAKVLMTVDSTTYTFRETTIPRDDTTRYSSPIVAYVDFPCTLRPGKKYTVAVTSDQGSATASVTVPGSGYLYNFSPSIFQYPRLGTDDIPVTIGLAPQTLGYMLRLFINFETWQGDDSLHTVHRRLEVPSFGDSLMTPGYYGYPVLERRTYGGFDAIIPHDAYFGVYKQLIEAPYRKHFHLISATFILTQVEQSFYNYFSVANGFRDPYSIRMDQPDYTNVAGGVGIFAAMVEDSLVVNLQ